MGYTAWASFEEMLEDLKLTDAQKATATRRIAHVKEICNNEFVIATQAWATGSYSRETIIRWNRDIDIMFAVSSGYWATYQSDSSKFLRWVRDHLNSAYPNTKVSTRQISIRLLTADDLQVDVVPAFVRNGEGFLIPDGRGGWQSTNPPHHFQLMKDANVRLASQLKPLVRLMKAWNHANDHLLQSFHLEMMMLEAWRGESTVPVWPKAVQLSLLWLPIWARGSYADPWSPGGTVDGYLSDANRAKVLSFLETDQRSAAEALRLEEVKDYRAAHEKWNSVFRRRFPAYG